MEEFDNYKYEKELNEQGINQLIVNMKEYVASLNMKAR